MLLVSLSDTTPFARLVRAGIEERLKEFPGKDPVLEVIYLENEKYSSPEYMHVLKELVLEKISQSHPDLYITLDWSAYNLVQEIQNETGENRPVITTKINDHANRSRVLYFPPQPANNIVNTTLLALSLFPDTKSIVLVQGNTRDEQTDLILARESLRQAGIPVAVENFTNVSLPELENRVASLPEDSLIYFLRFTQDSKGQIYQPIDVLQQISNQSQRPIFCGLDTFVGNGAIGGLVISNKQRGRIMADYALQILNGTSPDQIRVDTASYNQYQFDYRQLLRFGIDPSRLPEGSVILNRDASFWEKYSSIIIGLSLLFTIETLLIALLLIQRRRRFSAEQQLRESEERYRVLIEKAPDAIIVYDVDNNRFLDANPTALRLLGCSYETLLTMSYQDFYLADQPDGEDLATSVHTHIEQLFHGELVDFERKIRTLDDRVLSCEVRLVQLPSMGPRLIRASFRDITLRKQAEEELHRLYEELEIRVLERTKELQKTQEAFRQANIRLNLLSGITRHDILNQLTGLIGYLKISLDKIPEGPVHQYLSTCYDLTRSVQAQIEFTRVYEDIGTHEPVWQELKILLDRVVLLLPGLNFRWYLQVDAVSIQADPMLEKVFYTLVENTQRHGERATEIRITSHVQGLDLIIVYEDNGSGIAENDKGRIFDRHFGKHTGYGLYVSEQILSITEMTIRETGTPGIGVRFEIVVPEGRWRAQ
jgi:PAS domain S-box-containing protein